MLITIGYYKTLDEAANARAEAEERCGFIGKAMTIKEKLKMEDLNGKKASEP